MPSEKAAARLAPPCRARLSGLARLCCALICCGLVCLALFAARPALAGGGPQNLFLVVNSSSWASISVANHFIRLRGISPLNVYYMDWNEGYTSVDVTALRERLLIPVVDTIERRGLWG